MGCNSSSAAPKNGTLWAELKQRLPLDKTPEQQKKRDILFSKFDEKKSGSLTQEQCLAGCKQHLELDKLSKNLPEINKRAFAAASNLRTRTDATTGVDPAEFRLYLQYIRDYFELNVMFDEVDTSDDRIVTLAEFKSALPRIEKWGLKISNPDEEFKKVDKDGKGVTFDAFADWAIRHNLDAEKDAATGTIPQHNAPAPAAAEPKKDNHGAAAAPVVAAAAPTAATAASAHAAEKKEEKPEEVKKTEEKKEAPAPVAAPAPAHEHEPKKETVHPVAAPAAAHVEEKKEEAAPEPAPVAASTTETKVENKHDEAPAPAPAVIAAPAPASAVEHQEKKTEEAPASAPTAVSAAQRRKDVWPELKKRLPRKKTPEDNAARDALFTQFDPNGNGYLSYAEIERGAATILKLNEFTDDLHPILVRAYNAARNARKGAGANAETQDAYVERVEFRLLLVYIYDYFELWVAFDEIDAGDDKKVSLEEFKHALPKFQKWGVPISDPEAEFNSIDKTGNGSVTFAEFSEWAITKHLNADGEENQK